VAQKKVAQNKQKQAATKSLKNALQINDRYVEGWTNLAVCQAKKIKTKLKNFTLCGEVDQPRCLPGWFWLFPPWAKEKYLKI
jgi:hypothetical protein